MEDDRIDPGSQSRRIHWLAAVPLSAWCPLWVIVNGWNYLCLTWDLFARLKWSSFVLLVNPCFGIWLACFSASVWGPMNLLLTPWVKYGKGSERATVILLVLLVPLALGLALQFIGPYFYPITWGGETGTRLFLRFIPILGGKGYNADG